MALSPFFTLLPDEGSIKIFQKLLLLFRRRGANCGQNEKRIFSSSSSELFFLSPSFALSLSVTVHLAKFLRAVNALLLSPPLRREDERGRGEGGYLGGRRIDAAFGEN